MENDAKQLKENDHFELAKHDKYRCCRCKYGCNQLTDMICHIESRHPDDVVKYRKLVLNTSFGRFQYQSMSHGDFTTNSLRNEGKHLETSGDKVYVANNSKRKRPNSPVSVPKMDSAKRDSPFTPHMGVASTSTIKKIEFSDNCDQKGALVREIESLLPHIIDYLDCCGETETYVRFTRLLASRDIPLTNICYLLFSDVVLWYSIDNTSAMRYRAECASFWQIGYRLFHGKFLRFMSGERNLGQILEGTADKGETRPEDSNINFAVPSRNNLYKDSLKKEPFYPGIDESLIVKLAEKYEGRIMKLGVDGKKICRGKGKIAGDIDCWGFEPPPSLEDRKRQHEGEIAAIKGFVEDIETLYSEDVQLSILFENRRQKIVKKLQEFVKLIAHKNKLLRDRYSSLKRSEEKFRKMGGDNWTKSKYYPLISSIRVNISEINKQIEDSLLFSDKFALFGSILNLRQDDYRRSKEVIIEEQQNCFFLNKNFKNGDNTNTRFIPQRSKEWFDLRKRARVTGSTCNKAVGLDKLKTQQAHFDSVFRGKAIEEPSEGIRQRMTYGVEHEQDAIATMTGKVLPFLFPDLNYFEEGCALIPNGDMQTFMVVSPDGSFRKSAEECPMFMYENKCKAPDSFAPYAYYQIPKYYVIQLLSEMKAYGCKHLLFSCWSKQSVTIFRVTFDPDIWSLCWAELDRIYGIANGEKRPTCFSDGAKRLREMVKTFQETRVELLGEFPPCFARHNICDQIQSENASYSTPRAPPQNREVTTEVTLGVLRDSLLALLKWFQDTYYLLRTVATEILVFMVNDLDRIYKMDISCAHPIAYALKGPSMTVDVFRKMTNKVIKSCEDNNLCIGVTASDGQWHQYGVRDSQDKPLTVHQLHRDHWKSILTKDKNALISAIKRCYVVRNLEDVRLERYHGCLVIRGHKADKAYFGKSLVENPIGKKPKAKKTDAVDIEQNAIKKPDGSTLNADSDFLLVDWSLESLLTEADNSHIIDENPIFCKPSSTKLLYDEYLPTEIFGQENDFSFPNYCESTENNTLTTSTEPTNLTDMDFCSDVDDNNRSASETNRFDTCFGETLQESSISNNESFMLQIEHYDNMSKALRDNSDNRWKNLQATELKNLFESKQTLNSKFLKADLQTCLTAIDTYLTDNKVKINKSFPKYKMVDICFSLAIGQCPESSNKTSTRKSKRNPLKLQKLCTKAIGQPSKQTLAKVVAEHSWHKVYKEWLSSIVLPGKINGLDDNIEWFSKPCLGNDGVVRFHFTDACHILTCLRTKVCTTGIAGLRKEAWEEAALSESTALNVSVVLDCVDKQDVSIARRLFAKDVAKAMHEKGYTNEAEFCKLVGEWFDAEDEPSIDAVDRCRRRMCLRRWLLERYCIGKFPPSTQYVRGIPVITFEALVCHTERKLQLYGYLPSDSYNARATGSQEVENFFSTFNDLEPTGRGIPKPDSIPSLMASVVEIDCFRINPNKPFFIKTSRANVYPNYPYIPAGIECPDERNTVTCMRTPEQLATLHEIIPRDHFFDKPERDRTKHRRRSSRITKPGEPSHGERGVRPLYHARDDTKILAHHRMGYRDIPDC